MQYLINLPFIRSDFQATANPGTQCCQKDFAKKGQVANVVK